MKSTVTRLKIIVPSGRPAAGCLELILIFFSCVAISFSVLPLPYVVAFIAFQAFGGCVLYRRHIFVISIVTCAQMLLAGLLYDAGLTQGLMREVDSAALSEGIDMMLARHRTMSIVIAAYNEHEYIARTLRSIYETTPSNVLKEIIIVDDASTPPLMTSLSDNEYPCLSVVHHLRRKGLTKSKMEGGNLATGDIIMFLDAHVKPEADWYKPILKHINTNYRRLVVPLIPTLNATVWEIDYSAVGIKMMFDWGLRFNWFDDGNDLVPCMSGGLFAISKSWWHESGEYDYGMLMWGSENIEQSIRVWLCGGEIYVARNSVVGHVFRETFPYAVNYTEVVLNKIRAVETWFDEYKKNYYEAEPAAQAYRHYSGDIFNRLVLKKQLHCQPFREYVERFKGIFEENRMVPLTSFLIRDGRTDQCLQESGLYFIEQPCNTAEMTQRFLVANYGTGIKTVVKNFCFDANAQTGEEKERTRLYHNACDIGNPQQAWRLEKGQLRWGEYCVSPANVDNEGRVFLAKCNGNFLQGHGFQKFGEFYEATDSTL